MDARELEALLTTRVLDAVAAETALDTVVAVRDRVAPTARETSTTRLSGIGSLTRPRYAAPPSAAPGCAA